MFNEKIYQAEHYRKNKHKWQTPEYREKARKWRDATVDELRRVADFYAALIGARHA